MLFHYLTRLPLALVHESWTSLENKTAKSLSVYHRRDNKKQRSLFYYYKHKITIFLPCYARKQKILLLPCVMNICRCILFRAAESRYEDTRQFISHSHVFPIFLNYIRVTTVCEYVCMKLDEFPRYCLKLLVVQKLT